MRHWTGPRDGAAFLLLGTIVALFFLPTLTGRVLFFSDVIQYAPHLAFTGRWLKSGRFALWNPYLSLGAPHVLAQPFYPLHAPLAALFADRVCDIEAAIHALLSAVGTFALARAFQSSRTAALVAASAYALGGFTSGHLEHLNILVALAWIPLLLLATERYLAGSQHRPLGLAMLVLGLMALGGHPQIVVYGLLAQGVYCLVRLGVLARRGEARRIPRLVVGLLALWVVGLALGAISLLPFVEWLSSVSRGDELAGKYAVSYSLPPRGLLGLVAPFWFGGAEGRPRGAASFIEFSSYVGLLPLALAAVALARLHWRAMFFFGLGLAALLLALGGYTPLYGLVLATPILGSVRAPARFLVLVDLSLAMLAALGLDSLRAGVGRSVARAAAALFLGVAGLLGRAIWLGQRSAIVLRHYRADTVRLDQPDTVVLLATLVGASATLWALGSPGELRRPLLRLAVAFAIVDLLAFRSQLFFYRSAPANAFEEQSLNANAILHGGGDPRFYTQTGKEAERLVFEDRDFEGYRRLTRESLLAGLPMRFGLQSLTGQLFAGQRTETPVHGALMSLIRRGPFDSRAARLAGAFGVRYVIASPIRGVSAPELTLIARGLRDVYRNELAVPRAYLVPESRTVADPEDAIALLKRPTFDPRRTVVLEVQGPPMPEGPLIGALTEIVHEEPNRIELNTLTDRPAWLVLNDTFAPGWTASIDGRPAPVLRANGLVRAVAVETGHHRVSFRYAPASVGRGAAISTGALAVIGILVRPRRSPSSLRPDTLAALSKV